MTDKLAPQNSPASGAADHDKTLRRLKQRHAAERRFRFYGLAAIGISVFALFVLVFSILSEASSAFTRYYVNFELTLSGEAIIPDGEAEAEAISSNVSGFNRLVQANLLDTVSAETEKRSLRRQLFDLTPRLAVLPIARQVAENPGLIGTRQQFSIAASDNLDLFLKGRLTERSKFQDVASLVGLAPVDNGRYELSLTSEDWLEKFKSSPEQQTTGSMLISVGGTWFRILPQENGALIADYLGGPRPEAGALTGLGVRALHLATSEANRTLSDHQIAWAMMLKDDGRIVRKLNWSLLSHSDSTYPELAGAAAAIAGSVFTMIVTALFALPVGILAAIYLEEFAPKNRLTSLIEVNINNLAAVPSIVFGLLGAAVFLGVFGMPRSIPLVGGLVLGLLVLPTVIIASRTALRAVPPSIRTAALGMGASRTQTVFHHTLPLAAPGILTGAIIAMARALGETAPLLLIGMVAFVNEVPSGPTDESTVLPVLIYKWFSGAERAWEPMTSAVIVVLLILLIAMNLTAVLLRRRFERRW